MSERRPIASRNSKFAAQISRYLADRNVSPNHISQASVVFAGIAGLALWMSGLTEGFLYGLLLIIAALGCQLRLLCNLFDGMVAVEGGKGEPDGAFWNEAPDRLADTLIFVGIGLGSGSAALGWAAAALAIGTAYVRSLGGELGLPSDFRGPMAKPQRMALVTASALIAVFLPSIFGWSLLNLTLWVIVAGTSLTIFIRSRGIIDALKSQSQEDNQARGD